MEKLDYIDVTSIIGSEPLYCQCGTKMEFDPQLNSYHCPNEYCIKHAVESCMTTLKMLDTIAYSKGMRVELETAARENYDALVEFINDNDIVNGSQLINEGLNLGTLGTLGVQMGKVIDNITFDIRSLGTLCGSELLAKLNVDITRIPENSERYAVSEINRQLGINNSFWLAKLIYEEYNKIKSYAAGLADYLMLTKQPTAVRDLTPTLPQKESNVLADSNLVGTSVDAHQTTEDELSTVLANSTSISDAISSLEDAFTW